MTVQLSAEESALCDIVGPETYLRGRAYAQSGAVRGVRRNDGGRVVFGQVTGNARHPYVARAAVGRSASGEITSLAGTCTCPVGVNCKHTVALVLTSLTQDAPAAPDIDPALAGWQLTLDLLLGDEVGAAEVERAAALQFEVDAPYGPPTGITIRPVLAGRTGWVRTGISWANLSMLQRAGATRSAHRLLRELVALHAAESGSAYRYYSYREPTLRLEKFTSRRLWDILAELPKAGVPLVQSGRPALAVEVHGPAETVVDVQAAADDLRVSPQLLVSGAAVEPAGLGRLGDPAHGIAWREPTTLHLAALPATVDSSLLGQPPLVVPRADRSTFFAEYLPRLRRLAPVVSSDESVVLPEPEPPRLRLTVEQQAEHRLRLTWAWRYVCGEASRTCALEPANAADRVARDADAERTALAPVLALLRPLSLLFDGDRLAGARVVSGMATVRFLTEFLPALSELVDVDVVGEPVTYRESAEAPVIRFDAAEEREATDWFDLAVSVSVDGEDVPFVSLFTALAQHESFLILPSGTYFALDRPEFAALEALIEESRALLDAEPGTVRVGRLHAAMWDDLERIGTVSAQADAWRGAARALSQVAEIEERPVPSGLHATLRPYQLDGFNWLAFLYEYGLGGVLADEMGLGKTVQALALICHVREKGLCDAPFLVVAPTSVVHNWAAECRRFAPDLDVRTITETRRRRRTSLADVAGGAAVVVTSYTLFRLEHDAYAELDWAGLLLDEAQFAKNHQTLAYQCARRLDAPFKLAITGTPLENNLMELWALLSITAPGLFPVPGKFEQYYRAPIEKGRDSDRLDQLRRRVRPLMLRRTKAQVITDLPDKQEQVLDLDLNPRHRTAYQRHLQRERQKVLGLLGDLDRNRFEIFRSLTLLRQASLDAGLVDPAQSAIPSTKLDALLEQLVQVAAEGHRAVVFSQFTRFLELARRRLDAVGIAYAYLDGKTKRRAEVIEAFTSGSAPVFLISLKAGGFGLNLTQADYCFLLDPWWNPAVEAQAVDRLHRIGQTRKVMVYRLVARDTIEEKVMTLKAAKAALFSSVVDGGGAGTGRLTAADIRALVE